MSLYDLKANLITIERKMETWAVEREGDVTGFPLFAELELV